MPSHLYPNRHVLSTMTERGTETCWRIKHLREHSARLSDEDRELWTHVSNSDYPNGLIHDESCRTCRGTNLMGRDVIVGYSCIGCGMRGELEIFDQSSCLELGAGFYEELRAEHEMGEHDYIGTVKTGDGPLHEWRLAKKTCPLCIERLIAENKVTT
jgi:hypothetical protein